MGTRAPRPPSSKRASRKIINEVQKTGKKPAGLDTAATSALAGYHLFPSVRGDLLMKMGRFTEAREEIQRAIAMTKNLREQELLVNKLKQLEKAASSA